MPGILSEPRPGPGAGPAGRRVRYAGHRPARRVRGLPRACSFQVQSDTVSPAESWRYYVASTEYG
eukprot:47597-Hanusia_phi.AAC.1